MSKPLVQERFNPTRLPGLSLWLDAQATTTISSTTAGVTSWADRSGNSNTLNASTFFVPGCTLWLDAADPNATGVPAANGAIIATWRDKSGLGSNATMVVTGWTQTSARNLAWTSIASSSDGTKLVAAAAVFEGGGIWRNANSGAGDWTQTSASASLNWSSIASSSDGTKLAAATSAGGIWTNANSGVGDWIRTSASTTLNWTSIASSSDGTKLAATAYQGGIWTNANSGVGSWTPTSAPVSLEWASIASSSDGIKLTAVASRGGIYTNANSGVGSWTLQTGAPTTTAFWTSIASSSDGTKLAALALNGIWTNANSGVGDWIRTSASTTLNWTSIASSSDGTKLAATAYQGGIYTNANSGAGSWTPQTSAPTTALWWSIASSSDGTKLAAVVRDGGIWRVDDLSSSGRPVTINSTGLNGRPTMNFNGSSWFAGSTVNLGPTMTAFVVMQHPVVTTASYTRFLSMAPPRQLDQQVGGLVAEITGGQNIVVANGNAGAEFPQPNNTPYIMGFQANGTNLISYLNGTAYPGSASTTKFDIGRYRIGSMVDNNLNVYTGYISEVVVFNTSITTFQRQQVEIYLSKKWGVPLPYSVPTTPLFFSSTSTPIPIISNTLTSQPSIFFPRGAQMISTLNSGLGAPTIPDCTLWLDGADTTTITSNATTGITQWADKSGSGYNAVPAIFTIPGCVVWLNPGYYYEGGTVNVTSMNNLGTAGGTLTTTAGTVTKVGVAYPSCAYLSFAAGSSMKLPPITYTKTSRTVIAVVTVGATGGVYQFLTGGTSSTDIQLYSFFTNIEFNYAGTRLQRASSPQNFFNSTSILCATSTTADRGIFVNGAAQTTDINDTGAYTTGTTTTQVIGNGGSAFSLYEMMIFDGALTTFQRQQVEGYLAYKYNLQAKLLTSHPYYATPFQRIFTVGFSPPNITTTTQNGINAIITNAGILTINNFKWTSWATTFFVIKTPTNLSFFGGTAISSYAGYIATFNCGLYYTPTAGFNDSVYTCGQQVIPLNEWCIFSIGYGGGTQCENYAVNGTLRTSTTTSPGGYQTTVTPLWISAWGPSSFYGGDNVTIGEVIQFNRSITSQERQTMEGYLATKWGLRPKLPPTHPYFSTPFTGSFSIGPVSKAMFMAYQCPTTTSTMRFGIGSDAPGQAFGLAQSNGAAFSPYQYEIGNTSWSLTANTYVVPNVLSAMFDASRIAIRGEHNFNAFFDVRETALISSNQNTPYVLGTSLNLSSLFTSSNFHVCEIITYNRALGTTDRQMVEGYLAWKWGMTAQLPIGHPYKTFPPSGEQVVVATTPSNGFTGLVSWIDMADSRSYTLSGTVLKTLSDKVVGAGAYTISGNPNALAIDSIGDLPAIRFAGNSTGVLSSSSPSFLTKALTVSPQGCAFAVLTPAATQVAANRLGLLGWGAPGNNLGNPALAYTSQSSVSLQSYNTAGSGTFYGPQLAITPGSPIILFWAWYGGNMFYLSSNGSPVLSSPQTAGFYTNTSTNNQFYIGNDGGFGASFNLGELCVYSSFLQTPFRNMIEGYLAWKWGLQNKLPLGHPYILSAPSLETLTEVGAMSQPCDISGITLWLDAADTTTIQQINSTVTLTGSPTLLGVSNGYTYYAFNGNGTITSATPLGIQYFAVGGGGGGGFDYGAGGGAGGLQTNTTVYAYPSQVSTIRLLVPGATYSITIGTGGAYQSSSAAPYRGSPGGNTTFVGTGISITALGGGGGGGGGLGSGGGGGCGGGGGYPYPTTPGGTGTQGGNGITGVFGYWGGAGGGIGGNATSGGPTPLNGGPGLQVLGTFYGGGGGGAGWSGNSVGSGGSGVGGRGAYGNGNSPTGFFAGIPPVENSGGGGAGGGGGGTGTAGAAGIFIVGIPQTQLVWIDKSPVSNSLFSTSSNNPIASSFGPPSRPSIYFGPGSSATSIYNSGADSKQFSAFLVASIPTLSFLLVSTGQLTTGTAGAAGQTFGFFASNGLSSVLSPLVVQGTGATNNAVGNYSVISGKTIELHATVCGTVVSGNMNFATPLTSVVNTATGITVTPWVFGNCTGDILPKSFHVHEFITYNRPVTTIERQFIEGYLYWKWMV